LAIRIGLSIEDYWNLTPAEFYCHLEAYRQNLEITNRNDLAYSQINSWNTANYSNAKKLPNLKNILKDIYKEEDKISNNKRMSNEEIKQHYQEKVVK